jgi:hypothetical protein
MSGFATFGGVPGIKIWIVYSGGKWYYNTMWDAMMNPNPDPMRNPWMYPTGIRSGR